MIHNKQTQKIKEIFLILQYLKKHSMTAGILEHIHIFESLQIEGSHAWDLLYYK